MKIFKMLSADEFEEQVQARKEEIRRFLPESYFSLADPNNFAVTAAALALNSEDMMQELMTYAKIDPDTPGEGWN